MARIPWEEGNGVVARHIRAYDPRPGAFTHHKGEELKLFGALATEEAGDEGSTRAGEVPWGSASWAKVTLRAEGSFTSGEIDAVRVVGPRTPAT